MGEKYVPARPTLPGNIIKRELKARGWTQKDLSEIINRPYQAINEIINGSKQITADTAIELAHAFGTSPELWMNLESHYRLFKKSKSPKEDEISRRSFLYEFLPITEMVRRNWIAGSDQISELEDQICKFLNFDNIDQVPNCSAILRQSNWKDPEKTYLIAWVKRVEQLINTQKIGVFNIEEFKSNIGKILDLTDNEEKIEHLPKLLNELGVYFYIVPHLSKTYLDGATFLYNNSPVIALTLRYKRTDYFWFTLMHEIAHIYLGHEKKFDWFDDKSEDHEEKQANELATNWLIDKGELIKFFNQYQPYISREKILDFSEKEKRHPSIIIGQLHNLKLLPYKNMRNLLGNPTPFLYQWSE